MVGEIASSVFLLFLGGAMAVLARRVFGWNARLLRQARPWLSKYIPYDERGEQPIISGFSRGFRREIWLWRLVGAGLALWSLVRLILAIISM